MTGVLKSYFGGNSPGRKSHQNTLKLHKYEAKMYMYLVTHPESYSDRDGTDFF